MIGNDLIDLQHVGAISTDRLSKMRKKVLRESEQILLDAFFEKELSYWVAWAAKESVYKLEFQSNPVRYFRPKAIECRKIRLRNEDYLLEVSGRAGRYLVSIKLLERRIEALALTRTKDFQQVSSFLFKEEGSAWNSVQTKHIVAQILAKHFPERGFSFQRTPFPTLVNETQTIPLSISHHGAWLSIQLLVP